MTMKPLVNVISAYYLLALCSAAPVHESKAFSLEGVVMRPGNEWGSYYNINMTQESEAFEQIFKQVTSDQTPCAGDNIDLLRYYKSYDNPEERIYSYFCRKSKGYEHLRGNYRLKNLKSFHKKLSDFKIYDAGSYPKELTIRDKEEVSKIGEEIWGKVWNKFDLPEECVDPDLKGTDHIDNKYENYLLYYRFPLMCSHGLRRMEVNIFVDEMYGRYNEGKPTLCYTEKMVSNLHFLQSADI